MGQAKARAAEIKSLKEHTATLKKDLGQVFTPFPLVKEILDKIPTFQEDIKTAMWKTYFDPACGNGRFLLGVVRKLMDLYTAHIGENKVFADNTEALDHIFQYQVYGMDLDSEQVGAAKSNLREIADSYGYVHSEVINLNVVTANTLECNIRQEFTKNVATWKRPFIVKTLQMLEMTLVVQAPGLLVLHESICKPEDMVGLTLAANKFKNNR